MRAPRASRSVALSPAATPPHDVALLRVRDPHGHEQVVLLDRPALQVGSDREVCGLVLRDPTIAAIHCTLRWQGARWILHDRGAPTGTYINNLRCREPTALRDGDRLTLAHHRIDFTSLPSLALPHVLARLRDLPIDWTTRPVIARVIVPPTPIPPRTAFLAGLVALITTLVLLAVIPIAPSAASAIPADPTDLSHETSPDLVDPPDLSHETSPDLVDPPDLSHGTSSPRAPPVLAYVTEPPQYELPPDAIGLGTPTAGALLNAIRLPSSPDYTIRCPAHAYATSATIGELMHALASLRNRGHRGDLVVGDLSRPDGGQYGPHKSHQSGRDVDIWLPIRGGRYDRGCARCGTDLCRPEPGDVDWQATWRLIEALAERDAVQDIFLDWTLHPALRQAALELGVPEDQLDQTIQHPVRGRATLIKHSDGHVHHLHVRYREPT